MAQTTRTTGRELDTALGVAQPKARLDAGTQRNAPGRSRPFLLVGQRARLHHPQLGRVKIVQVVPSVADEASGTSYAVPALARALGRGGHDVELLSVLGRPLEAGPGFAHRVFERSPWLARLWRSPALFDALARAASAADVLHSHGLWMLPNMYPGWVRCAPGVPRVISPHGTLLSWALGHSRWKKRAVWALAQGRVVREATCLHATAEDEYHDLRRLGLRQPICVIPNGIDIPPEPRERGASDGPRTILYLGRLHIKKGIDRLLRAWAVLAPSRPDWCVSIVGPDDGGHATELRALARGLGVPRVTFSGPVYGAEKQALYQRAALHVLPSHSENFGMTVAEALACGTPVISTHGTPWSGLEREGCGFWIEHGVEPLTRALSAATAMPRDALAALGARGRGWMRRDYSWDGVGRQMADVYHWLSRGGAAPASIRLD